MPSFHLLLALILLLTPGLSFSQYEFPAFGKFSAEEIKMKECSFDKEAEAVILLDQATITYGDNYEMMTERRIRIKILNDKGLGRADIVIPYYSRDDFESISNIRGFTFNYDESGKETSQMLDPKSVFNEKANTYYSRMKFAMPSVKAGSIIEYQYTSTMKNYGGLDEWMFQSDLPVIKSCLFLQIVPTAEFTYQIQKKSSLYILVKPFTSEGKVYFEMNNIPALRFEPYMDAPRDYIQKVMFQLSGIVNRFGGKQDINTTWRSLAYDLMTEKDYGAQLDKDLKAAEIKNLVANAASETEKLKRIYDYLQKNIVWNGFDGKYAPDGVKSVWDKKKGSAGEINLLLVNLLKASGIEAYPVMAAERDFGKIDTLFPFIDKFNKTVVLATADGKQHLLDATQTNSPVGLTPYALLNTTAFLVDKKKFGLLKVAPGNKTYKNVITINGVMDKTGLITAEANVKSYEYARKLRLDEVKNDRRKFISENFEKGYEGLTVDSFQVLLPEHDSLPFEQSVRFNQQLDESGGYVFVNPNYFTRLNKNPFTSAIRFTNINFGFPYSILLEEKIKLPAGTKIDLPGDKIVRSEDNRIEAVRLVTYENGELKVLIRFTQIVTLIGADGYAGIKEYYKKMTDALNEPIVIKLEK